MARQDGVEVFYFEAFDEAWKVGAEGTSARTGAFGTARPAQVRLTPDGTVMLKLPTGQRHLLLRLSARPEPAERIYPSVAEIREDLHILHKHWRCCACTTAACTPSACSRSSARTGSTSASCSAGTSRPK